MHFRPVSFLQASDPSFVGGVFFGEGRFRNFRFFCLIMNICLINYFSARQRSHFFEAGEHELALSSIVHSVL